jgi:sugar phosphate isomerase/epimerase
MHPRISINSSCFRGASWRELADALDALGVDRVSFAGTVPDPEIMRPVVDQGGLQLESVVHPFLYGRQLDAGEDAIAEERRKLTDMIRLVASLGGRSVFLSTGGRGALTWEQAAEIFCEGIAPCIAEAEAAGVLLMVENTPQLYADVTIVHTLRDTIALAEMAGIGVCLDVFSCWTEAGLEELIARAVPRCHLVQVNDYILGDRAFPCRAVPGDGAIPLRRMLGLALAAGYGGVFDLEMSGPRIDAEGHLPAARRGAQFIRDTLLSLGA